MAIGMRSPLKERLQFLKALSPRGLKRLANQGIGELLAREWPKARRRVSELEEKYPSAAKRELAQRLIDHKKQLASMVGGVSGVFGLASVPADLLALAWLQLQLLVDVATVYHVNLNTDRARGELLEILGYADGLGSLKGASPKVLGRVAASLLEGSALETVGRALPLVAAPVTAYLNNQHIQRVGERALRFYEGFDKASEKNRAQRAKSA